jgi:hypothetical protein
MGRTHDNLMFTMRLLFRFFCPLPISSSYLIMLTDLADNQSGLFTGTQTTDFSHTSQNRVYDEHERAAIDIFKKEYMEATTPTGRRVIAQLKIFPALFNYWESIGDIIDEKERKKRSKVCIFFVAGGKYYREYISLGVTCLALEYMEDK